MRAVYRLGQGVFDLDRGILFDHAGQEVPLRAQSLAVLRELLSRPGAVVERQWLMDRVWPDTVVTDDSLVQCVGDIRRAIGDSGHQVLKTVLRRGYRLDAVVADDTPPAVTATAAARPPSAPAARSRWAMGAAVALLLCVAAVLVKQRLAPPPHAVGFGARPPLAVLPFRTAPAEAEAGLGVAVAEELIGHFARNVDLPVVSGRSSFAPALRDLPPAEVASRLGVRYLVDGRVRREGEQLVLAVELVDGRDGRLVWRDEGAVAVGQIGSRQADWAAGIAGVLASNMRTAQKRDAVQRPAASLDVYALTLRGYAGKHGFTPEAYRRARTDLLEALQLDPAHAPAWAVLGYLNTVDAVNRITGEVPREQLPQALALVDRAIELDAELPIAYQARAIALAALIRPAEALEAARTAVRLAPGDADNLAVLAKSEMESGLLSQAPGTMRQAVALYPIKPPYIAFWEAQVQWAAGDLAAGLRAADYCLERAPKFLQCRVTRWVALVESGRTDEARHDLASAGITLTRPVLIGSVAGVPALAQRRAAVADALALP